MLLRSWQLLNRPSFWDLERKVGMRTKIISSVRILELLAKLENVPRLGDWTQMSGRAAKG